MRILQTVEFYSPSVGGCQEVVRQISERLAERGHEVTVATSVHPERKSRCINGVAVESFDVRGNIFSGYSGETDRYQRFLADGRFDVVLSYSVQQWATDLALDAAARIRCPHIVATVGLPGLHHPELAAYHAGLARSLRKCDAVLLHSADYRDAKFAREHGIDQTVVIPNGAAEEEFCEPPGDFRAKYGIPADVPLLLTVGSHTGMKGHSLCMQAFQQARIGRGVLVVIGNQLGGPGCLPGCKRRAALVTIASGGRKRVLLLDPPRADVLGAYHAADLFVFGSNLECSPVVLFEAMASRTAFATVAAGNAEEIVRWGGGGIVVPSHRREDGWVDADPSDMARAIEQLVGDPERRAKLAAAGHAAWRRDFTWDRITDRYESLYQQVATGRHPALAMA